MLKFRVPLGLAFIALLAVGLWLDGVLDRLSAPGWWPAWLAGGDGTLPASILVLPVLLFLCVLVSRELSRILRAKQVEASTTLTCGLAIVGLLVSALAPEEGTAAGGIATSHTAMALVLVGSLVAYARHRRTEGLVAAAGGALLAYAYIGVLLGFWGALRRDHSEWVLFWLLLTTKASDIGAFFAGRAFGKRKMAPWLSPGKTWEGFAGGVAMSALVGGGGAWWFSAAGAGVGIGVGVGLGAAAAVLGQAGDLVASLLKRDAGRKDAGSSVPGFGGVLDVVDSLLLVGPAAYWTLRLLGSG